VRYLSDGEAVHPRPPAPAKAATTTAATSSEKELRRQLAGFVRRAYEQRLMISTQGAFSVRLDGESFLITPHRVDRSTLDIDDIVLVRRGEAQGESAPSSSARGHRAIYERHAAIEAIVNAYPVNATAFSVSTAPLDTRTIPESYLFLRDVR